MLYVESTTVFMINLTSGKENSCRFSKFSFAFLFVYNPNAQN